MPKTFDIDKFNKILSDCGQLLAATKISMKEIVLSNGVRLTSEKDIRICKKRVMEQNKIWAMNFDKIYGFDSEESDNALKECKAVGSSAGGKSCQEKFGNKIRQNLNTGTPWNKSKKNGPNGPMPEETKRKIGLSNSGKNNGMFGKKQTVEEKEHKSNLMKEKILSGKFTPNSNNRNTHWNSYYKDKKYRSSWESLCQYFDSKAEYESLRIKYNFDNKELIYIVDFVNHETKTATEVKPSSMLFDKKTKAKLSALAEWCNSNYYQLIIADEKYLTSLPMPENLEDFDSKTQDKIRKLYEARP